VLAAVQALEIMAETLQLAHRVVVVEALPVEDLMAALQIQALQEDRDLERQEVQEDQMRVVKVGLAA
jgi:hypothetical protein